MKPTRLNRKEHYNKLFNTAYINEDRERTVKWYIKKLEPKIHRYKIIASECKIPWYMLACIHSLEGGMDFENNIQNGQNIRKVTTIVPKGRGPYKSFEDSVREEFLVKRADDLKDYTWDIADVLWFLESHNGFGYYYKEMETPYLWSFTNHYKTGYYVRDGVFKGDAVSRQAGAVALILGLIQHGHLNLESPVVPLPANETPKPDIAQDVIVKDPVIKLSLFKKILALISDFFNSMIKKKRN